MSVFEKIVHSLQTTMQRPTLYGTFHIVALIIAFAIAAFLVWKFKDAKDKTLRRLLLVIWVVITLFEVYKQLVFSLSVDEFMNATWRFQWFSFPFQFCSTPLYLMPILIFAKEGKFRNAITAYMATFSLFAGLIVMFYPSTVFVNYIGINIQTMVHHGMQIAVGVLLVAHNRHHLNKRFFAWSVMVFTALCVIALIFNIVVQNALIASGSDQVVNMFYISPYISSELPVFSTIYPLVPYPVFFMIYLLGFSLVALIIYAAEKGA